MKRGPSAVGLHQAIIVILNRKHNIIELLVQYIQLRVHFKVEALK